jgi:hypothetical protein
MGVFVADSAEFPGSRTGPILANARRYGYTRGLSDVEVAGRGVPGGIGHARGLPGFRDSIVVACLSVQFPPRLTGGDNTARSPCLCLAHL